MANLESCKSIGYREFCCFDKNKNSKCDVKELNDPSNFWITGSSWLLPILSFLVFAVMITFNVLAMYLPLNGQTTAEISDKYPNLFTPANYTFMIWGVIYILVALTYASIVVAWRKPEKIEGELSLRMVLVILIPINLLNTGWIIAWHYNEMTWSLVIMIVLLIIVAMAYLFARNTQSWTMKAATSAYLGWISVATIANITAYLVDIEWDQFDQSEEFWMLIIIGVIVLLGLIVQYFHRDFGFTLILLWALMGIFVKQYMEWHNILLETVSLLAFGVLLASGFVIGYWLPQKSKVKLF